jgi:hypothetical protein
MGGVSLFSPPPDIINPYFFSCLSYVLERGESLYHLLCVRNPHDIVDRSSIGPSCPEGGRSGYPNFWIADRARSTQPILFDAKNYCDLSCVNPMHVKGLICGHSGRGGLSKPLKKGCFRSQRIVN